jgi:uncharacterized protein
LILVDANLLVYARVRSLAQHESARSWLDQRLNGTVRVGLPWPVLVSFVRLVTNPRVFARPATIASAWEQVEGWLACDPAWIPQPTERHAEVLGGLLRTTKARGNLVHDADLAALAIEHGLVLCSSDGDFGRFPGLRWENPLAGAAPT